MFLGAQILNGVSAAVKLLSAMHFSALIPGAFPEFLSVYFPNLCTAKAVISSRPQEDVFVDGRVEYAS